MGICKSNLIGCALSVGLCSGALAGQIDITTFNLLERGMTESEILYRAGPPDLVEGVGFETSKHAGGVVTGDGLVGFTTRSVEAPLKQFHYIPGPREHDPHLTVITFRGGVVSAIERIKMFTRSAYPPEEPPDTRKSYSDHELKIRRIERTLKAAEAYTATRERLKQQRADESGEPAPPTEIYRATADDGSVYFGDRPPPD